MPSKELETYIETQVSTTVFLQHYLSINRKGEKNIPSIQQKYLQWVYRNKQRIILYTILFKSSFVV